MPCFFFLCMTNMHHNKFFFFLCNSNTQFLHLGLKLYFKELFSYCVGSLLDVQSKMRVLKQNQLWATGINQIPHYYHLIASVYRGTPTVNKHIERFILYPSWNCKIANSHTAYRGQEHTNAWAREELCVTGWITTSRRQMPCHTLSRISPAFFSLPFSTCIFLHLLFLSLKAGSTGWQRHLQHTGNMWQKPRECSQNTYLAWLQ